jgi:hypothetical protein
LLRLQILEGHIDIAGPLAGLFLRFLRRCFSNGYAAAFSEAAQIHRKHVDAGRSQLLRQLVPNLALPVALMQ